MKPRSKRVTVEWKYPSRRKRKRSTFIGGWKTWLEKSWQVGTWGETVLMGHENYILLPAGNPRI